MKFGTGISIEIASSKHAKGLLNFSPMKSPVQKIPANAGGVNRRRVRLVNYKVDSGRIS